MFICKRCGTLVGPKVSMNKVVVKTVVCDHPKREYLHKGLEVVDPGGMGTQIVKEEACCKECAK